MKKLNNAVAAFKSGILTYMEPASKRVNYLESVLNNAPEPVVEVLDYCDVMLEDNNRDVAIQKRWLTTLKSTGATQNIDYSASSPSVNGYVVVNDPIIVERGATFRLQTVATQNGDDLSWCRIGIFADWNCDSIFDTTTNEKITIQGSAKTQNTILLNRTYTIRVPETAKPGQTRLRICYNDAWGDVPQPCGELMKGFAMDIPLEIVEKDTKVTAAQTKSATWQGDTLQLAQRARLFVYNSAGALVDQTSATDTYSVANYLRGTYVILAVEPNGMRSQIKFVK